MRTGPASNFHLGGRGATRAGRRAGRGRVAAALLLLLALAAACVSVSRQDEIDMGRKYSQQINQELPLIEDEVIRGPVNRLGHELARVSPRPDLPYEFQVVNTNIINAFAVPGGFIYMNRGLIEASDDMAEVAGVLAHEVSHVVARHSAEQLERMRRAQLGLVGLSVLFGRPEGLAALGVNVGANLFFAKHSREDEAEADSLAVGLLRETGWDPCGLVDFFRTMLEVRGDRPGAVTALFASHPVTENRIRTVDRIVERIPAEERARLRTDFAAYGEMKSALADYPPPPKKFRVEEKEGEKEPPPEVPTRACPS